MRITSATMETRKGSMRTSNSDRVAIGTQLAAVIDGMGGYPDSAAFAAALSGELLRLDTQPQPPTVDAVTGAIQQIAKDFTLQGLHGGACFSAVLITSTGVVIMHAGDTEAWYLSDRKARARLLTPIENMAYGDFRTGKKNPSPPKNWFGDRKALSNQNIVTNSIGSRAYNRPTIIDPVTGPGKYVLTTDGFTDPTKSDDATAVIVTVEA